MHNTQSPLPDTDETIEAEIVRRGLTAPRITPAHIEDTVLAEQYHVFDGTMLTVCCLTLQNGFQVVGESACASPANFEADIGRRIARANAVQKIWALEGYLLRDRLHQMTQRISRAKADLLNETAQQKD